MKTKTCIVAVCVVVLLLLSGTSLLADDPVSASREALVKCLLKMAVRAQEYYVTPTSEGGGGGSFANLTYGQLTSFPHTADGSFVICCQSAASTVLYGTGIETGFDGSTPTQAVLTVYPDSVTLVITN